VTAPCPVCGADFEPRQNWCMECGVAARTRLAPTPDWRVPVLAIIAVELLSLAILVWAATKLAGT
jgi:uncharacterized OB-fold protein